MAFIKRSHCIIKQKWINESEVVYFVGKKINYELMHIVSSHKIEH